MPMRSRKSGTGSRSDDPSMICRSPMKRVPTSLFASCTSTARPARAREMAAARPDGPAPAMRMGRVPDIESKVSYPAVSEALPPPATPVARRSGSFAVLVGAGILLSRISGLVREKIFAHFLGNSDPAGVFKAAIRIPNLLQNLFGEGVLSASFIPVYAKLIADGEREDATRVAGAVFSLLALVVSLLVL